MKLSCPKCKSRIDIQRTFNKKMHVSCSKCGIEDILEFSKNVDEVFLEFLSRYDQGLINEKGLSDGLKDEGVIRRENEIIEMIGNNNPDKITKEILFSKKDYIAQYKILKNPDPKMGCKVKDLGLDESISEHLEELEIGQFYKFQEESIQEIMFGENVVIEAPTASGKTEAFLIPVIQRIKKEASEGNVFAIFIYPTKALSRDQYPKIQKFAVKSGISVRVFDGDTKQGERSEVIEKPPHIIITNFDILHYHMWHQTKFSSLLSSIRMVIVDEAHVYSGIFGSNVHYIIKRLKRICKNRLQFIAASATLENAKEFCQELFSERMQKIQGSGKKGQTDFVMLFPSLRTQRKLMVELTKKMTEKNHKTMIFNNSHLNSELLAIQAKKQKINIKVHRAGLMANYRTFVEKQFKDDKLLAISCTPTLELGIDVGNLDCVISSTIPVNRLIQRIGRAARKGQRGYAFLTLGNDPISQYYKNHPDDYFEDIEKTYIDPKNPFVEEFQVLSMACDKPISKHELKEHQEVIEHHIIKENLIVFNNRIIPNMNKINSILNEYSIRGIGKSIDIFLSNAKVGDRILPIALEELHKDAIYFLAGVRYRVKEFDYPKKNYAKLERIPRDYPYYTKSLTEEWPTIKTVFEKRNARGIELAFCKLHIQKKVYGYVNIELGQEITQGEKVMLDTPLVYDFVTKGIVFHAPKPIKIIESSEDEDYTEASGYHATEHVVIEGSNMITGGVSQDLGGISLGTSGLIFIYDGAIGGSGASKALYERFEKSLERSMYIVKECPCQNEAGCPRCTFSYRCGNNNEYLHKYSALEILERINNGEKTELIDPTEGDKPLV
ncbi:MAG: DEAD/DEAH box helicase [Nitrosopumilus sp.]|nr:DEAD/DEAH box helicase [Nitrosopumilus sp.]MDH3489459.1 DEAD/DEAH box helicase [Nitrosopumilus sp.]MDH3516455.1 DEAD/DEAH box helicase [Nitrosopumilus sp.]MDH3565349.1 DEAD/DEAH box helicase [Nitrosopumilus sp.]MDH5553750.1 DEAD/DEAH box helicase [Nitrosopumilus sp.]